MHDQRERALAQTLAAAVGAPSDDITVQTAAGLLGTVHRILFQRIQDLTLAELPVDEIAGTITTEATNAFDMLEPALADYAVA
ncbi:hypothetical protein ACFC5Z_00165 [Streptomyces sp. NPDC056004]|uniref:hypothetical protein n=1 Tax=unclassified Streptomyces TaxID=2593676 RepID=UPI0035DEB9D8